MHHLVCPVHTFHKLIIPVNFSWLHTFNFSILSQDSLLCWGLKWTLHVTYPAILVTELGLDMHKSAVQVFDIFVHFLYFNLFWKRVLFTKYISVVDQCPDLLLPCYHTLRFLPVRIYIYIYIYLYLFINSIPKSIYRSSSNGYRNSQRIKISNLALCIRQPVTKIGSL